MIYTTYKERGHGDEPNDKAKAYFLPSGSAMAPTHWHVFDMRL